MTILASAKVLIVGGRDANANVLATAETYDPATDTFASTSGPMPGPRTNCTATLLNDGRVLVTGGVDGHGNFLDSAVIYDPGTDSFAPLTAHLAVPREQHRATLLNDGTVLITGGVTTPSPHGLAEPVASAELFDPVAGTFSSVGAMSTPRATHVALELTDGRVLVAGGATTGLTQTATADLYDPATRAFSATGSMAYSRDGAAGVLLGDGRALVTGGAGAPVGITTASVLTTAEIYNPASGRFMPTANNMPEPHFLHAIALLPNGKVLVAAGFAGSGPFFFLETQAASDLFDPSTNTFTAAVPLNIARTFIFAAVLGDGRVFIPGGENFQGGSLADAELYSIAGGGTFGISGGLHSQRVDDAAIALPDGKVLISGGIDGFGKVSERAELYDPASMRLTPTKTTMTVGHHGHTMTMLKTGKVLIAGGNNDIAELYDPATDSFVATAGKMTAVRLHSTATLLNDGTVLIAGAAPGVVEPAWQNAEIYDPATDHFTAVAALMRSPRVFQVAALLPDGTVLLAGGSDMADNSGGATNTAEIYNPAGKTFSDSVNTMSAQRYAATATVLTDGSVLIVDGEARSGTIPSADLYSPVTGKFSPTAGPPGAARVFQSAVRLLDGSVLVIGGAGSKGRLSSTEFYNPVAGTFTPGPSMVYGRAQFTATTIPDGTALIAGGVDNNGFALPITELFVP
jgi:N-acetylneuraminic acid mutarotase